MSLAAWMPSSFRFFSICLLRAMAARSSADEAHPMAMARTAWLATRGSAVPLACSRPVVARRWRRARASERTRASCRGVALQRQLRAQHSTSREAESGPTRAMAAVADEGAGRAGRDGAAACARERMTVRAGSARCVQCAGSRPTAASAAHPDVATRRPLGSSLTH